MNELKRVCSPRFLIFAGALFLLNAILILNGDRSDEEVSGIYDEMVCFASGAGEAASSAEETATLAWQDYFTRQGFHFGTEYLFEGSEAIEERAREDSMEEKILAKEAANLMLAEAEYIDSFHNSIRDKMEMAAQMMKADIVGEDSFEYLNLLKTRYDLSRLGDLQVELSNGIWLDKLYDHFYIQIFILMLLFVTVYSFFAEKKTGLYYIIHTAEKGRGGLFVTRFFILAGEAFLFSLLFHLESAAIYIHIYGGMEGIHCAAASDERFLLTAGTLTRVEFTGVMILVSFATATVLSLLLWYVLSLFRNINIGVFIYLLICGMDILAYMLIPYKSVLRPFRFVNLYFLLFPNKALIYYNWGYSFVITSLAETTLVLALALGVSVFLAGCHMSVSRYYSGKENVIESAVNHMMETLMRILGKAPDFVKEIYKILVSQRAGILLLLLLYIVIRIPVGPEVYYDATRSYLSQFYREAEGMGDSAGLETVYRRYREEYEEFVENLDYNISTAEDVLYYRNSLMSTIDGAVGYVKRMNDQGIDAVILMPYEYVEALGTPQGENQKKLALINVLAVMVISCGFLSYEKKNEVYRIALAYCNRRRWIVRKLLANLTLTAIFEAVSYGIYYDKLSGVYDLANLWAPLKSLPMFEHYAWNPSIFGFIVTDLLTRFVILAALSAVISYVSVYVKYAYCLIISMVVTLPQLLYMIGFDVLDRISIGRYMAFLPCFYEGEAQVHIYYGFAVVMVAAGEFLFYHIIKKETVQR